MSAVKRVESGECNEEKTPSSMGYISVNFSAMELVSMTAVAVVIFMFPYFFFVLLCFCCSIKFSTF